MAARIQQGMWPVNQALYPKLTHQIQNDPARATKMVRLSLLFLGGLGLAFGIAIYLGAPRLVRLALGPGFENSVSVLRVLAFWIPLTALSTILIFQVLLPNHLDNQFNLATFTSALVSIAAAVLLAPSFGAVGIAWSAVISQAFTLTAYSI